jgi:protoporphyrinogen oxidase
MDPELRYIKPVVIVGSGISGLYTAFVLSRKGYPVSVFEKEESIGGRMYTEKIHPTKNKTYLIEGGAGVIKKDENLVVDLCKFLDVELKFWKSETAIVLNNGSKSEIWENNGKDLLEEICTQSSTKSFGELVSQADIETRDKMGILVGTTYSELYSANGNHVCEENDFNEFLINDKNVEYGKPVKGWKELVKKLRQNIEHNNGMIFTNSPVKEIGEGYVVVKGNIVEFSHLIVTCPLHFFNKIKLSDSLNDWYHLARKYIGEIDYLRVYSYFERPLKITKKIATNLPLQRVIPINDQLIMTVYNDGHNADMIHRISKNKRKLSSYLRSQLEKLLETRIPKIKENWVIFWKKGIAFWKPNNTYPSGVLPSIQQPEENIHFCGDTYSLHPGWITGAIESSNDCLDVILKTGTKWK